MSLRIRMASNEVSGCAATHRSPNRAYTTQYTKLVFLSFFYIFFYIFDEFFLLIFYFLVWKSVSKSVLLEAKNLREWRNERKPCYSDLINNFFPRMEHRLSAAEVAIFHLTKWYMTWKCFIHIFPLKIYRANAKKKRLRKIIRRMSHIQWIPLFKCDSWSSFMSSHRKYDFHHLLFFYFLVYSPYKCFFSLCSAANWNNSALLMTWTHENIFKCQRK